VTFFLQRGVSTPLVVKDRSEEPKRGEGVKMVLRDLERPGTDAEDAGTGAFFA